MYMVFKYLADEARLCQIPGHFHLFIHARCNIPKLADNMSGVVISSVLMATFSMASHRASGAAVSAGAGAAKSGAGRILRR